jgi:hypothetical protein
MSSQGPAELTGYNYGPTRDAQDWTRQLKEKRAYYSYSTQTNGNKDTENPWIKFANGFKVTYNYGKLACGVCNGNAFEGTNSTVGGS